MTIFPRKNVHTNFPHTPDSGIVEVCYIRRVFQTYFGSCYNFSLLAPVGLVCPDFTLPNITERGYQPLDRCVWISRLTRRSTSKSMLCHIFDLLTKILAHGFSNDEKLKLEESNIRLKFRLPWPTNVRLPVIMLLTCCCGFGRRCHSQHLGMTDRSFNPNSAVSFSVSL